MLLKPLKVTAHIMMFFIASVASAYNQCMPIGKIVSDEYKPTIKLGIDVLKDRGFDLLAGKNVGLLTSGTEVNSEGKSTIQLLSDARNFNLVATFEPYRGILSANSSPLEPKIAQVLDIYDNKKNTACNITPSWLSALDVLVVDLQDTGSRFCTNISCMLYVMSACFANNVEIIILDRPNPLGNIMGGPAIEEETKSFLGPIVGAPMFHGITIGEVANLIKSKTETIIVNSTSNADHIFNQLNITPELVEKGKLTIVPMKGWKREMTWTDTELIWSIVSQKMHDETAAYDFATIALAFLCANITNNNPIINFHHVADLDRYFSCISSKDFDIVDVYDEMEREYFDLMTGLQLSYIIDDTEQCLFVNTFNIQNISICGFSTYLIASMQKYCKPWTNLNPVQQDFLRKCIGDTELCNAMFIGNAVTPRYYLEKWTKNAQKFKQRITPYLLY